MGDPVRKAALGCALVVLAAGAGPLRAHRWKTAAALALVVLGGGHPFLAAGAAPGSGAGGLRPWDGPGAGGGVPGQPLAWMAPAALAGVEDPDCGTRCGGPYETGLIRCEVFQQQMRVLKNLCLAELDAALEACYQRCEEP